MRKGLGEEEVELALAFLGVFETLLQPLRMGDLGERIGKALHDGRDGDDLLDGLGQSLLVVLPVDVRLHAAILQMLIL